MSWRPKRRVEPTQDPAVEAIWDPPPDAVALRGFLTRKEDDERTWRLFRDLSLRQYVDLDRDDILHSHRFADDARGSVVWVPGDLVLGWITIGSASELGAAYLGGGICGDHLQGDTADVLGMDNDFCTAAQKSKRGSPYSSCCGG